MAVFMLSWCVCNHPKDANAVGGVGRFLFVEVVVVVVVVVAVVVAVVVVDFICSIALETR